MATFVLVHGAYDGGWAWRAVRDPRQVPFLIKPATDRIRLQNGHPKVPRTFIRCVPSDPNRRASPDFDISAMRARTEPGWTYRELDSGHGALWEAPAELAALLIGTGRAAGLAP